MGVQRLTSFAKEQPQIYSQINILEEIQLWQRLNPHKKATIIFDVMGFVHVFGNNKVELNLGGRQHQYIRTFERFVRQLIDAGASLAFICDGQLQSDKNDVWCQRRNAEYQNTIDAMTNKSGNGNVNAQAFLKLRFGCKSIVKSLLKLVEAKRYGKVIISTQVDCDLAIAKYASECSALAVIASDSDFLIFDGGFQLWHTDSLRLNLMEVNRFECNKLLTMLNLTREQMKCLAAIAGNDKTSHLVSKSPNFNGIADFCRSLCQPREQILKDVVKFARIDHRLDMDKAIDCVAKSIKSYDIDGIEWEATGMSEMDRYCSKNVLMYAFRNQQVFQYELNFVNFNVCNQLKRNHNNNNNNLCAFVDILVEVFRKLGGIILKNTDYRHATLKIVTKYDIDDDYTLRLHTPIYPKGFFDLDAMIFGELDVSDDIKWKLLLWSLGLSTQLRFDLQKLPKGYLPTVLALMFLLQNGQITLMLADTVLVAQYHIQERKMAVNGRNQPTDVSSIRTESVRIAHMFNRIVTLTWDCLMVCGLQTFIQLDWFDGPYFNHLLQQFQKSENEYNDSIKHIQKYRIYVKLMSDDGMP